MYGFCLKTPRTIELTILVSGSLTPRQVKMISSHNHKKFLAFGGDLGLPEPSFGSLKFGLRLGSLNPFLGLGESDGGEGLPAS